MRAQLNHPLCLGLLGLLAACASPKPTGGDEDLRSPVASADLSGGALDLANTPDLGSAPDLTSSACPRLPAPADRVRKVVVSLPYDANANKANVFAVWELGQDGALTRTAERFTMGRALDDHVHFTPDGQVGLVAQEDGTIGVFRLPPAGQGGPAQVVHAAFKGRFYAERLTVDAAGERVYVVDYDTRENGGGIYSLRIGCDGTLTEEGLVVAAQLPRALHLLAGTEALVAAPGLLESPMGTTLHRAQLLKPPQVLESVDAFGDGKGLVSALQVTPDGKYALVGDNDEFSGIPNRIAVVKLSPTLGRVQVLTPLNDPYDLAMSPYGNAALMLSGYGNAVVQLAYDPQAAAPFTVRGEPTYQGKKPQLPAAVVVIDRGALRGQMLLAENTGVRRMRFGADGLVTDLGLTDNGAGLDAIVGTIGVQP